MLALINYVTINILNKKFSKGLKLKGGRNNLGRVCIKPQGGGNKKLYRFIDFYRRINSKGKLIKIFYDTNRTGKLGYIVYENGMSSFILLQKEVKINSILYAGTLLYNKEIKKGDSLPLKYMPLFTLLSNIETKPFKGGILSRSAGVGSLLIGKEKGNAIIKFNSGWQMILSQECMASFGNISKKFNNQIIGKAGKNRALGKKPKVRGVAKNPCDHPHGGGNGKKSKPMIPVNSWNTVFKWKPTKNKTHNKYNKRLFKIYTK